MLEFTSTPRKATLDNVKPGDKLTPKYGFAANVVVTTDNQGNMYAVYLHSKTGNAFHAAPITTEDFKPTGSEDRWLRATKENTEPGDIVFWDRGEINPRFVYRALGNVFSVLDESMWQSGDIHECCYYHDLHNKWTVRGTSRIVNE